MHCVINAALFLEQTNKYTPIFWDDHKDRSKNRMDKSIPEALVAQPLIINDEVANV